MQSTLLLSPEASVRVSLVLVNIAGDVVQDDNHNLVLIGQSLEGFRMLEEEVGSLDVVYLPISPNEVVSDSLDVVDHQQLQPVRLDSLRQVHENLVVVFQSLAVGEDDLPMNVLFRDLTSVAVHESLFDLIESLLVEWLAGHEEETFATQTTVFGRQEGLQQELDSHLGLSRARLAVDLVELTRLETATKELSEHLTADSESGFSTHGQLEGSRHDKASSSSRSLGDLAWMNRV